MLSLDLAATCTAAVAIIWFGYPLAVWLMGRLLRSAWSGAREPGDGGTVTLVIATRDSAEAIARRVDDLVAQRYPRVAEIVVGLDASSTVGVADVEALVPRGTIVVRSDGPGGKPGALNAAVARATGDTLVFSDTAQRFLPGTVESLAGALRDARFGAVSGALRIGVDDRPRSAAELYWRGERWLREQEARLHSVVGVTGAIWAMRRSLWAPLPDGLILDDVYAPMRLVLEKRGLRVGFVPRAVAVDERRFSSAGEYRRKVRTLTGVLQLCVLLPGVVVPWRNPIFVQFLFHKLLRLLTPYLLLVAGADVGRRVLRGAWMGGGTERVLAVAVLAGGALGLAVVPRLRAALAGFAAMQVAVVRATINGLRGDWDVWSR